MPSGTARSSKISQKSTASRKSPPSTAAKDMRDSARAVPRTPSRHDDFGLYDDDDAIFKHFFRKEDELRLLVKEYYYDIDVHDFERRRYTIIESTDARHQQKVLLELINDDETIPLLITFDNNDEVIDMKIIKEIDHEAEAWKVVHRNIDATNEGCVKGQLACYADVVSPYYDKGRLKRAHIKLLLRDWRENYQYYHMREIWTRVRKAPSRNSRADYMVDVQFEVTWQATKGRYKHSRTYIATYGVRTGIEPKIVSTTLKRC